MAKYSHQTLVEFIELCKRNIDGELTFDETKAQARYIIPSYSVDRLKQEISSLSKVLNGIGSYGFSYPANWFAAILEVTDNSENVINAAVQQQEAYLEKDGKVNNKLDRVLASIR